MDKKTHALIVRRVRRGMKHLDKVRPGWYINIDLDELFMESGDSCIVGMVCHTRTRGITYHDGLNELGFDTYKTKAEILHGFVDDFPHYNYGQLQAVWENELRRLPGMQLLIEAQELSKL